MADEVGFAAVIGDLRNQFSRQAVDLALSYVNQRRTEATPDEPFYGIVGDQLSLPPEINGAAIGKGSELYNDVFIIIDTYLRAMWDEDRDVLASTLAAFVG